MNAYNRIDIRERLKLDNIHAESHCNAPEKLILKVFNNLIKDELQNYRYPKEFRFKENTAGFNAQKKTMATVLKTCETLLHNNLLNKDNLPKYVTLYRLALDYAFPFETYNTSIKYNEYILGEFKKYTTIREYFIVPLHFYTIGNSSNKSVTTTPVKVANFSKTTKSTESSIPVVRTKEELQRIKAQNVETFIVEGELAGKLYKTRAIAKLDPSEASKIAGILGTVVGVGAIVAPLTGGASVAVAFAAVATTGAIAGIVLTPAMIWVIIAIGGFSLNYGIHKGYTIKFQAVPPKAIFTKK